jgi:hypothetical protein
LRHRARTANGAAMKLQPFIIGIAAMLIGTASPAFANAEVDLADRGTVPSCSITDPLPADMAKRGEELGYDRSELMPSTVTTPQFRGRLRCAKTLDGAGKMIGIALVEDFTLEGTKMRALYQGDMVLFSLAGTTPAATFPTRKGEFRCYRGGAAAVTQCTTGYGAKGASMLTLQNQNEDYLLGLSVSAYDWPNTAARPQKPLTLRFGADETLAAEWANQSLTDPDDVSAWTAIFEGQGFNAAMLKRAEPVMIEAETGFAAATPARQTFDGAEMIALYRAMAMLTRAMPVR